MNRIPAELGFELRAAPFILARILRIALRYRWRFALATATSVLATFFNLALQIIVLRQGQILEQGNHEQLVINNGLYADLYRRNFSLFDEDV